MSSIVEKIELLTESDKYDRDNFENIADELEEILGPAEMWNILRPALNLSELIENLTYIAKEADV